MSEDSKYSVQGERPLRTGPGDFDKFLKGSVWSDISYTIKDRITLLTNKLTHCETTQELWDLKGQITAWNEILGLPAYLKQCAHVEATNTNEPEETD